MTAAERSNRTIAIASADNLRDPALRDLLQLWNQLRRERSLPAREDLSPELLRPHLGWIHLLDVLDDPRDFRFRLYGSQIAEMLNHDVTGLLLSQAFAGDFLAGLHGAFDRCATSRQPWLLETTGAGAGKDHMDIHSLLLPLSPDDDRVTMIMVRHVFDE